MNLLLCLALACGTQEVDQDDLFRFAPGDDAVVFRLSDAGTVTGCAAAAGYFEWSEFVKLAVAKDDVGLDQMRERGRLGSFEGGTRVRIIKYHKAVHIGEIDVAAAYEVRARDGGNAGKIAWIPTFVLRPVLAVFGPGIAPKDDTPRAYAEALLESDKYVYREMTRDVKAALRKTTRYSRMDGERARAFKRENYKIAQAAALKFDRTTEEVLFAMLKGNEHRWPAAEDVVESGPVAPSPQPSKAADTKLKLAKALESTNSKGALEYYRSIVKDFPNTEQAKVAAERIKVLEKAKPKSGTGK